MGALIMFGLVIVIAQCRRTLFLFSRQKEIIMGAIIMSVLVSVIAIVGVIYFNHQDKKNKGTNS